VLGCILRELGLPAEEVIRYLTEITGQRKGHSSWPESFWQARQVQEYRPGNLAGDPFYSGGSLILPAGVGPGFRRLRRGDPQFLDGIEHS
jgi:hypothetical protein